MVASKNVCARPPASRAAWNHQIHATGGLVSSTTMVMVFVGYFVLLCGF